MLKTVGALLVVLGTSIVGFGFAAGVRRQARQLAALIASLDYLKSEITYRRTPLSQLFPLLAACAEESAVAEFWRACEKELRKSRTTGVQAAFRAALGSARGLALPVTAVQTLMTLGASLGQFNLEGQARALALARERLAWSLQKLEQGRAARCRSYATIGVCAGMAVAVILL